MILPPAIFLQQDPHYMPLSTRIRPTLANFKLPVLGTQKEVVLGPAPQPTEYEGFFINKALSGPKGNADLPPQVTNWYEMRVGYMSWSCSTYPFGKQKAWLLQTDGTYKQSMKDKLYGDLNVVNRQKKSFYIGLDGKLLQENAVTETPIGVWSMQANFNKDGYDLYLKTPQGEKKTSVNVPFDESKFDAMFTPMVKDHKVLIQEKEFYEVNPVDGSPMKRSAKYGGKWNGYWFEHTPYKGFYFDFTDPSHTERVYLTDEGDLFRVEEPDQHYLNIETKPYHPTS